MELGLYLSSYMIYNYNLSDYIALKSHQKQESLKESIKTYKEGIKKYISASRNLEKL